MWIFFIECFMTTFLCTQSGLNWVISMWINENYLVVSHHPSPDIVANIHNYCHYCVCWVFCECICLDNIK